MAISEISENARKVLEKRYLGKDEDGNVVETIDGMFRRVIHAAPVLPMDFRIRL